MKKWYGKLSRMARTLVIVGVVTSILCLTGVAAWLLTKDISGTGTITAAFGLTDFVGGTVLEGSGEVAIAECIVTNLSGSDATINGVTLTSDTPGVIVSGEWRMNGTVQVGTPDLPLESLRTVGVDWWLGEGYEVGPVDLVLHVTCSAS